MYVSEKPSGCDIEQTGVAEADGRGQGLRVKLGLLGIGILTLSVSCNIVLFLWIRNIEETVTSNAHNVQTLLELQNVPYFDAKYEDGDDDDDSVNDDVVVRTLRDGDAKGKKRKNRKRRRKRGCPCSDLIKKLKNKRDVSGQSLNLLTYMKGLANPGYEADPYNYDGIFLWQKPDRNLGNYFQYDKEPNRQDAIKAIKIGITGKYELKTQVTLGGSSPNVVITECGVKLVKSRGGEETELARSVLTQTTIHSSYGVPRNTNVLDGVNVGGIFYLTAGDKVFVQRSCNHATYIMNEELSSFSAVLWSS